jgi:hypothetical protein
MRAAAGFYFSDAPNRSSTPIDYVMGLHLVKVLEFFIGQGSIGPCFSLVEEFSRSAPSDFC